MIKDIAIERERMKGTLHAKAVIMEGVTQDTVIELRGLRMIDGQRVMPVDLGALSTRELCALSEAVHAGIRCSA